ncbi:hypothetical protein Ciccas_014283, partial [Cichlidogyrus casuarinus]
TVKSVISNFSGTLLPWNEDLRNSSSNSFSTLSTNLCLYGQQVLANDLAIDASSVNCSSLTVTPAFINVEISFTVNVAASAANLVLGNINDPLLPDQFSPNYKQITGMSLESFHTHTLHHS